MSFQPEGIDKIEDLHGKDDFACGNCLKSYKRKTAYEKHITTKSCKKKKIAIVPSDTTEKPSDDVPPRVLENIVDNENPSEPLDEQVDVASIEQIDEKENPPENLDDKSEDEDWSNILLLTLLMIPPNHHLRMTKKKAVFPIQCY